MNISSIVVYVKKENYEIVKDRLNSICDYHFGDIDSGKMIVTIEADSVEDEIKKFIKIENTKGVLRADMIQSYQEDIEKDIDILENSSNIPKILEDDSIELEDITYNGDLRKKIFT